MILGDATGEGWSHFFCAYRGTFGGGVLGDVERSGIGCLPNWQFLFQNGVAVGEMRGGLPGP
jgi:hypothetical protein